MKKDAIPFFPSHYDPNTDKYQENSDHLREAGIYGRGKCCVPLLRNMVEIGGILHDAGKSCVSWKQYLEASLKDPDSVHKKADHSTVGGQIIERLIPHSAASVMIQTAIYAHHGLQDSVLWELDKPLPLVEYRRQKGKRLPIDECCENVFAALGEEEIRALAERAREDAKLLRSEIQGKLEGNQFGSRSFYLGLFERMLMSLLIDADRRSTEEFMTGGNIFEAIEAGNGQKEWEACAKHLESDIAQRFPNPSGIDLLKDEISMQCKAAAAEAGKRYFLSVPTGSGKTLASLRFAVHHAKTYGKKRIVYVAPFQSIVEQNAEEIRRALGREDIVLEHHCSIVPEDDEEQAKYDRFTEDWQVPVVVTTAVQFLNAMFAEKTGNVRRFHSLCDSVIIIDEVQALPVKVLGLFNLGINFLTEFAGATAVLCTATQPLLEDLSENRLLSCGQMVARTERYNEQFRRVEITDDTELVPGGMNVDELAAYIVEKADRFSSVLFVGNTKRCVRAVYDKVTELCKTREGIWHLSTSMIPVDRQRVLKEIKAYSEERRNRYREGLEDRLIDGGSEKRESGECPRERHICISTQLIEAGVDVSFDCVIRSLAGLDSVIQVAGRCNRYSFIPMGHVFIVHVSDQLEELSRLPDIRKAQEAMRIVLRQFRKAPDTLDGCLDSEKAINLYFQYYFVKREEEMSYPVTVGGVPTTLVQMLSQNEALLGSYPKGGPILRQAFKTAGEHFQVIDEEGKVALVVEFDDTVSARLSKLEARDAPLKEKKKLMRELQRYSVSVSQYLLDKLKPGIRYVWDDRILVLDRRCYDERTGVSVEPAWMETLIL